MTGWKWLRMVNKTNRKKDTSKRRKIKGEPHVSSSGKVVLVKTTTKGCVFSTQKYILLKYQRPSTLCSATYEPANCVPFRIWKTKYEEHAVDGLKPKSVQQVSLNPQKESDVRDLFPFLDQESRESRSSSADKPPSTLQRFPSTAAALTATHCVVSAKFVPRLLTHDQRENRVRVCCDLKSEVQNDPNFLKIIVTGEESWCYGYDPESKQASSQWKTPNSLQPEKVRSNVKTMTFFIHGNKKNSDGARLDNENEREQVELDSNLHHMKAE
ncbi:hypothetical protein ANN_21527 [Periplaneta americana]|uniref:Uncharacterized protein n=1 Tax=Periplaneta americana TaxID=6978 RepID=A0ABQ8SFV9_PERAM|nr:hypothetical protein ANN_21527 [Periplaneta americana]